MPDLIDAVRQGPFKDEAVEAGLDRLTIIPFFIRYQPFKDQAVEALVQIGAGTEVTVPILIEQFVDEGMSTSHWDGHVHRLRPCEEFAGPDRWSGRTVAHRRPDRPECRHARMCGGGPWGNRPGGESRGPHSDSRARRGSTGFRSPDVCADMLSRLWVRSESTRRLPSRY